MEMATLRRTGSEVSALCFGTMTFAREADQATSAEMFAACRDAGINFFDCANVYAGGQSEQVLGKLMANCRDELVITSKVGMQAGRGGNGWGLSRRHIIAQCEKSLTRLNTDRLDVYFCHQADPRVPMDETLAAMDDLVRAGKIVHWGISNWSAWQVATALGLAERMGTRPPAVLQPMYSLAKRTAEIEILPLAREANLGVIPYSPLGGGLLTGKYSTADKDPEGRLSRQANYAQRYALQTHYEIAERFADYASQAGTHPVTLAVAWVARHPAVTAPIIGARNLEQLKPSLAAADMDMSADQWREISGLTPPVPVPTDRDEERCAPVD